VCSEEIVGYSVGLYLYLMNLGFFNLCGFVSIYILKIYFNFDCNIESYLYFNLDFDIRQ
jgi:hypothetical protein